MKFYNTCIIYIIYTLTKILFCPFYSKVTTSCNEKIDLDYSVRNDRFDQTNSRH